MQIKTEVRVYGLIILLGIVVLVSLLRLGGAYEREKVVAEQLSKRVDLIEAENRLTRVYVNDLWRRVVAAGIQAPPPSWSEPKESPP